MLEVFITCLPVEHSFSMARGSLFCAVVLPQVTQVVFFLTLGTFQGNPKGGKRGYFSHTSLGAGERAAMGILSTLQAVPVS